MASPVSRMHIEKHETLESLPSQAPYSLPPDEPEGGIAASILKRMKSLEEEEDKVAEPPPEFTLDVLSA